MVIDRWMDKEIVVHIHNGILLSHKKECIWVSSNEVNEPRTYYTEWSESEREILYSNTYMQNLEKCYERIYLQGNNGETDIENRLMDMGRGEESGRCMERVTWKLTLLLLLLSCFSRVRLCATPQTAAHQALLSLGFSRQEHWSGLPFPSPHITICKIDSQQEFAAWLRKFN